MSLSFSSPRSIASVGTQSPKNDYGGGERVSNSNTYGDTQPTGSKNDTGLKASSKHTTRRQPSNSGSQVMSPQRTSPFSNSMNRKKQQQESPLHTPTLLGQLHVQNGRLTRNSLNLDGRGRSTTDDRNQRSRPLQQNPHHSEPDHHVHNSTAYQHYYVLPVLLLEFLAIALTRAVLPGILLKEYGRAVYLVLGAADCVRGLLAFFACPFFGKLSDILLGRRLCLFITVLGSCAPVSSLAFFTGWDTITNSAGMISDDKPSMIDMITGVTSTPASSSESSLEAAADTTTSLSPFAIPLFIILLSLSGIFSSTFTLVFAYISDSVKERNERVSAYGLALATFGLSFTIGPMAGGYLANYKTDYVFQSSLVLTLLDLLYIYWFLPESKPPRDGTHETFFGPLLRPAASLIPSSGASTVSNMSSTSFFAQIADSISWSPWESFQLVVQDPFLRKVGQVAFFYYTGLWAVISTLSLYAVQHFHLSPERLGELMSILGLSTMVAEAVLVRIMVPLVGEKRSIRIGLASFALQCLVLGLASQTWELFVCVGFSLLGNLVYPSLSSLVSGTVPPEMVGEALGAINGIKALTEGLGPLLFGALMTLSEETAYPGSPYWLASVMVLVAYHLAAQLPSTSTVDDDIMDSLPSPRFSSIPTRGKYPPHPLSPLGGTNRRDGDDNEYIHELEFKKRVPKGMGSAYGVGKADTRNDDCLSAMFPSITQTPTRDDYDEEYQALLSEIEESDADMTDDDEHDNEGVDRLPNVRTELNFAYRKE